MRLGYVVLRLRIQDTRFGNRIAGAADLELAYESTLNDEVAFVIQLSDTAPPNAYDSVINQKITERFGVIVALKLDQDLEDKTGIQTFDLLHEVRQELFDALIGWQMPDVESLVYYLGGRLLNFDRAWLWYQFEFAVESRLEQMVEIDPGEIDAFKRIYAQYVLGLWDESEAYPLEGIAPYLTIDETDPDSGLRLVDMKQMVQEEE